PLRASAVLRYFIGLGLLLSPATFIRGADVELKAYWTKGREHWLVHIQPARSGIFIAPNSPVFANDQLIAVTDAVTRQLVPFRLRHSGERMLRSIDLAFPQLQKPMNLSLVVHGLVLVDQTGRRVGYNQSIAVRA